MGVLYNPDNLILREPGLLTPQKPPVGQLKINHGNRYANDLTFAAVFEGSHDRDIFNNRAVMQNGCSRTSHGLNQNGSEVIEYPLPPLFNLTEGTAVFTFESDGGNANSAKLFITVDAEFQLYRITDGRVAFSINGNYSYLDYSGFFGGGEHDCAFSWDQPNTTLDGLVDDTYDSGSPASWSTTLGTNNFYLMNRASANRNANGTMRYFYLFDRVLSVTERKDIHRDPYQIFVPS